jgi:AcrR family transcriptional regulator
VSRVRSRRPAAAVDEAILEAALEELRERGYAKVTFEGVAQRAGTSKPVLYRRHRSRAALVAAALLNRYKQPHTVPATDTLRTDLIAWLEGALARATAIGAATYRGLLGEADAETLEQLGGFLASVGTDLERDILAPARARGELGPASPPATALAVPIVLLRDRIIFGGEGAPSVSELVDAVCLPLFRQLSSSAPATAPEKDEGARPPSSG